MENNFQVIRTIKIGVVGDSKVNNIDFVREKVRDILFKIDGKLNKTPYSFIAIADSTDQIITNEIINFKGSNNLLESNLEIILKTDFKKSSKNKDNFKKLVDISVSTKTPEDILSKYIYKDVAEKYIRAGQVIVDKCDFLIVVEGENGSDMRYIVEYAMHHEKPVFIINSNKGSIKEKNTYHYFKSLEFHDSYNDEKIDSKKLKKAKENNQYLIDKMDSLNLESKQRKLIEDSIYPIFNQFLKADLLAMNYQSKHYLSINLVYYFSAASIAIVILQQLFLRDFPYILVIDAFMMFIVIVLLFRNKKEDWHRKWIDYRYLAERLRAAMIFSMVDLDCKVRDNLPYQRVSGDWILTVYESIYEKQIAAPDMDFGKIKKFVLNQWITGQKNFYREKSIIHLKKDKILNILVYAAFIGALIGAVFHVFAVILPPVFEIPDVLDIMTFVVIVFPAFAASIAGIRAQHEYLRISKRYSHIESYLEGIEYKINGLKDKDKGKLIDLLEKANNVMLREHQDWRIIFSSREPELP